MCSTVMAGIPPKDWTKCFSSAAPVGVHSSLWMAPLYQGMPRSSSAVAGAGTGRVPWAQRTVPEPAATGDAKIRSACNSSSNQHTPTMSATASRLPTSWKCTCSTGWPCT